MKECANCGSPYSDNGLFCSTCGARVREKPGVSQQADVNESRTSTPIESVSSRTHSRNQSYLKEIERRTYDEFMIDGITEILVGLILIISPLLALNVPIFLVYVYIAIFTAPIVNFIRERTTYPRIGRVEFKPEADKEGYSVKKTILVLLLFMLGTMIVTLAVMFIFEGEILDTSLIYKWVPLWFGLVTFGPSLFLVEKTGQKHYYFYGLLSTLLGFVFSILPFPDVEAGMYLYFFVLGILALSFGIAKYIWFIKKYPVIDVEGE